MEAAGTDTRHSEPLPAAAYAAALASVPGLGPKALRTLLDASTPAAAWAELVAGRPRRDIARWATAWRAARAIDVEEVWSAHQRAGITVSVLGQSPYPAALADDPEAPAVLFSVGDLSVVDGHPRVALVGTRSATRYGLGVAAQLGADLAAAGVAVVSGLALGIDGAAHEGALAAWRAERAAGDAPTHAPTEAPTRSMSPGPHASVLDPAPRSTAPGGGGLGVPVRAAAPIAVVAGSVDTPYPRQHAGLWRRVAQAGTILSEAPLGSADLAWRFPQRNRVMAAMADVVVVVECHPSGGSMHTVQAAARRGVPVGAVPGSIRSPASAGTNALLADGCFVVRDASDVLVAVGLATASASPPAAARRRSRPAPQTTGSTLESTSSESTSSESTSSAVVAVRASETGRVRGQGSEAVLEALGWERCSMDQLLRRTGLELDELSVTLERLRADGVVEGTGGSWERMGSRRNLGCP